MKTYNLSPSEQKVLGIIELDAELTAPEIARRARLKTPSVHRILQNLRDAQILAGRTAVIDTDRLGLIEFGIAICTGNSSKTELEEFFRYARKEQSISWVAEVGGGFDLLMNILAPNPKRALDVLYRMETKFPGLVGDKQVCIRTQRYRFWRGFFSARSSKVPRFSIGLSLQRERLEQKDREILSALSNATFESFRDCAQMLGMPIASFLRRLRGLKEKKVLLGFGFRLNLARLNIHQYRVLVYTTGMSAHSTKTMMDFVSENPWVKLLTTCLGPWSYELEIDVYEHASAQEVGREIRRTLGTKNSRVVLLPIFAHEKFISFPPVT